MALGERAITTVSSLTPPQGQNTVVNLCIRVLDEVNKDVEARGWWFQTSRGNIIGIGSGTPAWNASHPEEFRRYVTIRAARILQTRYITDETLHKLTSEEEIYSKAVLEAKDAAQNGFVTFGLPSEIEDLGITGVMFLQSNLEEKLATLKLGTELAQADLVAAQKLKVDKEAILIESQELLVDQQKLTEVEETAKRTAEKDLLLAQELKTDAEKLLVDAQELKTDAETSLIADQEALVTQQTLTEAQNTTKTQREAELLQAQELKVDAEKLLVDAQELKTDAETTLTTKQGLLVDAQELKTDAETTLVTAQELQVDAQTATEASRKLDIEADTTLKGKQGALIDAQELKTDAETTLTTKQGLLVDAQELKTDAETTLTTKQGLLVDAQELKTDAETTLTTKQGALVDAQELKTDAETTLTTKQGALVDSQELKTDAEKLLVDAQTSLTADQEAKTVAEKEILESQKTKLDAETAYMITAEKNWFDNGGVDISGTVRSYKDFRPEMRIMGIQEAAFQSLPAYKKVELIKDANQLRTDRVVANTLPNMVGSVNKVLRMLGVTTVSSNTNEHALASEAKELLEDTDLELQARGWWFNTEKDVTFTITSGKIIVNTSTSLYEELDDYPTARVLDGGSIVLKNLKDNTIDQFSGTIKGTRIVKRSISSLEVPQKYREYLEVKVAAILAELYPQSGSEIQRIRKQEAELESYFKDRENDQGNYNIFDNYDTNERIGFNRNYDLN